jgi:putative peptidoglycan lipid II flippase
MTGSDATADAAPDPVDPPDPVSVRAPSGSLVRASTVMAAGTVASRALGFVRSAVLVAALGQALTFDTFTVANTVPNIIYILLAGGVLNAVFVPQLVRAMKEGAEHSQAYTDRLLTLALLVL